MYLYELYACLERNYHFFSQKEVPNHLQDSPLYLLSRFACHPPASLQGLLYIVVIMFLPYSYSSSEVYHSAYDFVMRLCVHFALRPILPLTLLRVRVCVILRLIFLLCLAMIRNQYIVFLNYFFFYKKLSVNK